MSKLKKLFIGLTYHQASTLITNEEIGDLEQNKEYNFSNKSKLFFIYLVCLLICFLPQKNSLFIVSILVSLNSFIYIFLKKYSLKNKYLENFSYKAASYCMFQTTILSFPLGVRMNNTTIFGAHYTLVAILYIVVIYVLSFKRCEYMILEYFKHKKLIEVKSKVARIWNKLILKFTIGLVSVILIGTQFYRINRWWLPQKIDNASEITIQNQYLGLVVVILLVLVLVTILLSFSMIPTLFFDTKIIVSGILLKKYPEAFRKEYGFTKEEWYGEE